MFVYTLSDVIGTGLFVTAVVLIFGPELWRKLKR